MTTEKTIAEQDDTVIDSTAENVTDEASFDDVFDSLITPPTDSKEGTEEGKDKDSTAEGATPAAGGGATAGSDAPADGKSGTDKAGGEGGDAADASGDAVDDTTAEPAKTEEDPRDAQIRDLQAQLAAAKTPASTDDKKTTDAADTTDAEDPTFADRFTGQYEFTADEKAFLDEYNKEWGDVVKGERILRKAEYVQVANHILKTVFAHFGPKVQQALEAAEQFAEVNAVGFIQRAHSDYDEAMQAAVADWATNKLTGFKKRAALAVIESGTPEEINELLTEYKQTTGQGKPKVVVDNGNKTTTNGATTPAKTPLTPKAKTAAAAIAAPAAKRSATGVTTADKDDFDAGWADAVGGSK